MFRYMLRVNLYITHSSSYCYHHYYYYTLYLLSFFSFAKSQQFILEISATYLVSHLLAKMDSSTGCGRKGNFQEQCQTVLRATMSL